MTRDNIVILMKLLGGKNIDTKTKKWVRCSCLLAPWYHKNGKDGSPSFGIKINDNGPSQVNCFSCPVGGDVMDLILELRRLNKENPQVDVNISAALKFVATNELEPELIDTFPDFEELGPGLKKPTFHPFPEDWLATFLTGIHHPYLVKRGIPKQTALELDVRFDTSKERICFPIRTITGTLAGMQGRTIHDEVEPRYWLYDFKGKYNPNVWANEDRVNQDIPVVMTEGWFDIAKIFMVYPNVVGSLTSKIVPEKAKRLRDVNHIITFYDYGTGGDTARDLVRHFWPNAIISDIIPTEEEKDAGKMEPGYIGELIESCL